MDARGQVRAPTLLLPALTYVSPWALQCDLPLLPAPTPTLARVFSPTCVTRCVPGAGRRDLPLPSPQGHCCTPDPHGPNSLPGAGGDGKAPHGDPAFLLGFLLPGRDTALQEGFFPSCPPLSSGFFPFSQHFSLSEGEGVSGFWVLNTLCFADDVFPSTVPVPVPQCLGTTQGEQELWVGPSPSRLGALPSTQGEGSSPSTLPETSGSSSDVSPRPTSLFPATPRFAPAGFCRAKLLSCCRAWVWPPDGDLHPQRLLSIPRLPLQKCLLLSPRLLQLYPADI